MRLYLIIFLCLLLGSMVTAQDNSNQNPIAPEQTTIVTEPIAAAETTAIPESPTDNPTDEIIPEVSETAAPESTETISTPVTTPDSVPVTSPLALVYSSNLDSLPADLLNGSGWQTVATETGNALQASETSTAYFTPFAYTDMAAEASVMVASGGASLSIRYSVAGAYTAVLHSDGRLELLRAGVSLELLSTNSAASGWNKLRIEAIADFISVSLNDEVLITWQDTLPLGVGQASFGTIENGIIRVDDFAVYANGSPIIVTTEDAPETVVTEDVTAEATQPGRSASGNNSTNTQSITCPPAGEIAIASVSSAGAQGSGAYGWNPWKDSIESFPSLSSDGRYVVFQSHSTNLVAGDTNGVMDVFRFDRTNCSTIRVSVADDESQLTGFFSVADISDDGNRIVFAMYTDIYVRDVTAQTTTLIAQGSSPAISGNGDYVAFITSASLLPEDTNTSNDVYRADVATQTLSLVSVADNEAIEADGYSLHHYVAISDDGNRIAWAATAYYGLSLTDTFCGMAANEKCTNIFLRDISVGTTEIISVDSSGATATSTDSFNTISSLYFSMSGDGRYLAFLTGASLDALDNMPGDEVYIRDTQTDLTSLVSGTHLGLMSAYIMDQALSDDGTYLVMSVIDSVTYTQQVYVVDWLNSINVLASVNNSSVVGNRSSGSPVISDDGTYLAFSSTSTNLVTGDLEASCDTDWLDENPPNQVYDNNENCNDVFLAPVPAFPLPLPAPGALAASAVSQTQIDLSWTDNSTDETSFLIERSTDGINWFQIASVSADATSYSDMTASLCSSTFYYRIRAHRSGDNRQSLYSGSASATTLSCDNVACDLSSDIERLSGGHLTSPLSNGTSVAFSRNVLSADLQYLVFSSRGSNLLAGDTNASEDIFRFNLTTCEIERVSLTNGGAQLNGDSTYGGISLNGEIVFTSYATNVMPEDIVPMSDVFVFNGTTNELISINGTSQGNFSSYSPNISRDGRYVVFSSWANNLSGAIPDNNGIDDIFLYDRQSDILSLVSINRTGTATASNTLYSIEAAPNVLVINDKPYVIFTSAATNLVANDTNGQADIFLRDMTTGITRLVSRSASGAIGNGISYGAHASTDGTNIYIVYNSEASNLVAGDTNGVFDVFRATIPLSNLNSQTTILLSRAAGLNGALGNGDSYNPYITDNGRFVVFNSASTNLISGDTNTTCETDFATPYDYNENCHDVFLRDLSTNTLIRLSENTEGEIANAGTGAAGISPDGSLIVMNSRASNLVAGDNNNFCAYIDPFILNFNCVDVFLVRNPLSGPTLLLPANNSFINDATPSLDWSDFTAASSYELQYSQDGSFTTGVTTETGIATSDFTIASPLADGVWYWRVKSLAFGDYSLTFSFTVDTIPLATMPIPSAPANNAVLTTTRPAFAWSAVSGASSYNLTVDDSSSFDSLHLNLNPTGTSLTLTQPLPQGLWYWEVTALDAAGNLTNAYTTMSLSISILSAPANQAVSTSGKPTFNWIAQTGVTNYQLQADNNSDFSSPEINQTLIGTSFTPTSALAEGIYYWRVNVNYSGYGMMTSQSIRQFTVSNTIPAAPQILSPLNNSFEVTSQPFLSWTTDDGAVFVLELDDSPTFNTVLELEEEIGGSFHIPTLDDGLYYMRVKALNALGVASQYTSIVTFTVDTDAPDIAPNLLAPGDGSTVSNSRPTLSWQAAAGASSYWLEMDDNADFSSAFISVPVAGTTYTPGSPAGLPQGQIYWRVGSVDAAGNYGAISTERSFTIFIGLAPANASVSTTGRPTFTWTVVGSNLYNILIDSDGDFSSGATVLNPAPINGGTFTPATPLADGSYYWRVEPSLSPGFYTEVSRRFVVNKTAPAAPVLSAPNNAIVLGDNTPDLQWSAIVVAGLSIDYEVQLARNATFTSGLQSSISASNSFTPTPLADGVWYWRVRSRYDGSISGTFSLVRSFNIDTTAPAAPNLVAPANTGTLSDLTPSFTWQAVAGASSYRLDIATDSGFTSFVAGYQDRAVTGTSFILPNPDMLSQGLYYWRMRAVDATGNIGAYSSTRSFILFIGTMPANGAFSSNLRPSFTWVVVPGASSYTLEIDNDTDFSADLVYSSPIVSSLNHVPTSDLLSGTLYWRVVPNVGSTASYRTLFIATAPAAPVLSAPNNAVVLGDNTPDLQWNAVVVAGLSIDYEVQLARNATFTSGLQSSISASNSFTPAPLADGVWYWRVRSRYDGSISGTFSLVRSFNIDTTAPAAPNLVAPANAGTLSDLTPSFTWQAVAGASSYRLDIATDSGFTSFVAGYQDRAVTGTSFILPNPDMLSQGLYYWRMRAVDATGNVGAYSSTRSFSLFMGTAPANFALVATGRPNFTWLSAGAGIQYNVQVDDDGDFTNGGTITLNASPITTSSFTPATPLSNGVHYWRVIRVGETPISNVFRSVVVSPALSAPTLLSPVTGFVGNDATPTISWNAVAPIAGTTIEYMVEINRSATFAAASAVASFTTSNLSEELAPLGEGRYYWRVRARYQTSGGSFLGPISLVRNFTVDTIAPTAPVMTMPLNEQIITSTRTPQLRWNLATGAVSYQIELARDAGFTDMVIDGATVTTGAYTIPAVFALADGTYYWRVTALDAAGNSTTTTSQSFVINLP